MSDTSIITIENLTFSYGQQNILEDVHLTVVEQDSICVVGPNGGGKTTLLKIILGLLKPDQGKIKVFGTSPGKARLRIGYVPQYAQYDPQFPITVLDVVLMGRQGKNIFGHYTKDDHAMAMAALDEMGIEPLASKLFSGISGGQRQRALIARALLSSTELIILDEPTANIDANSEEHLFEILEDLNTRMAIMLVTHDVGFASKFFKSIACVNQQVVIHPTSELTGELIKEMYGGDMRMIRHDHRCAAGGHHCD